MSVPTGVRTPLLEGTWTVEAGQSTASFSVRELFRTVRGTIPVRSGEVVVAGGVPIRASAELETAGVDTATPKRDADLRTDKWFHAAAHPDMAFASTRIEPDGSGQSAGWLVRGTLTVKGIASPLDLRVTLDHEVPGRAKVVAVGVVDRFAAGVGRAPGWVISRQVPIRIESVLVNRG